MEVRSTSCCGVRELHGINGDTPEEVVYQFCDYYINTSSRFCMAIFTSNDGKDGYGNRLAEYIRENGFGEVKESSCLKNPNTNNMVRVFVWEFNPTKFKKFYTELYNVKKEAEKVRKAEQKAMLDKAIAILPPIGTEIRIKPDMMNMVHIGNQFKGTKFLFGVNTGGIHLTDMSSRQHHNWHMDINEAQYLEAVPPPVATKIKRNIRKKVNANTIF